MYLTSAIQRDRLFDLATRWFADRVQPGDGRFVTEVFIFESVIWAPTIHRFVFDILRRTHPGPTCFRRFRSKEELRAALSAGLSDVSDSPAAGVPS